MLVILKFLQSLIKTLHSEGTPTQIAGGIAIGAALGLTPLVNLHNVVILVALVMLNVSFGAGLLGMAIFAPVGIPPRPALRSARPLAARRRHRASAAVDLARQHAGLRAVQSRQHRRGRKPVRLADPRRSRSSSSRASSSSNIASRSARGCTARACTTPSPRHRSTMSTAGSVRSGDGPAPFSLRGTDLPPADPPTATRRGRPRKSFGGAASSP